MLFKKKKFLSTILAMAAIGTLTAIAPLTASAASTVGVTYQSQIQSAGLQKSVSNGAQSGIIGKSLRLEAINIKLTGAPKGAVISYVTQVQRSGWQKGVSNGKTAGTVGKSLRIEAVRITLSGMSGYAVQYRAYVQKSGWQSWKTTANGISLAKADYAGTIGKSMRIEAIEIRIVKTAPTIKSAVAVNISTAMNVAPALPTTIAVTMSDATKKNVTVSWDSIAIAQYKYGGTFTVNGKIAGTTVKATADVRVTSSSIWSDGEFKVGTDVPSGEYVIISNSTDGSGFEVAKDATGDISSLISLDIFTSRGILTVTDGQYLTISGGIMYKYADAPKVDTSTETFTDGMYKIGTDIPSGTYTVAPSSPSIPIGAYQTSKDSLHLASSAIDLSIIQSEKTLILTDGQYIETAGCTLTLNSANVTSIAPVSVSTVTGTAPTLTTTVTATMKDGSTKEETVTWDSIDPSQYASAGTFTVNGTIVDSPTVNAVATVTVS